METTGRQQLVRYVICHLCSPPSSIPSLSYRGTSLIYQPHRQLRGQFAVPYATERIHSPLQYQFGRDSPTILAVHGCRVSASRKEKRLAEGCCEPGARQVDDGGCSLRQHYSRAAEGPSERTKDAMIKLKDKGCRDTGRNIATIEKENI
jgi:hypothetical protein